MERPGRGQAKPVEHTPRVFGPWNTMGRPPTTGLWQAEVFHGSVLVMAAHRQAGHGLGVGLESGEWQQATASTEQSSG